MNDLPSILSNDQKIEVLYDHYKETNILNQNDIRTRYRLLLFVLLVLSLMSFQVFSPTSSGDAISEFVTGKLGLTTRIDVSFIGTAVWFALLALIVRYFQIVVTVERRYEYIHKLEEKMEKLLGDDFLTREGKFYLDNNYPPFLDWVCLLYSFIMPMILLIVITTKIVCDWSMLGTNRASLVLNTVSCVLIWISALFFMSFLYPRYQQTLRDLLRPILEKF